MLHSTVPHNSGSTLTSIILSNAQPWMCSSSYHAKGAEAIKTLLRLYLAMLYPVFLVSVWMFAMFAFTSYMVPKVFCKKTVISSEVRT